MTTSPNLVLPYIDPNQSQKHVTHNSALQMLDALVALSVIDDALTAPPSSPLDGDRHIIASGATGAWAGQDGKVAAWLAGAWAFLTPRTGWRAWVASRSAAVVYSGSSWQTESSLAGFRNRLRNASFAINQRVVSGTVTLAAGAYGHDGVKAGASGATYTFSASGIDTTLAISAGSLILPIEASLVEGGLYALAHEGTAQARVWQGTGSAGSGAYAAAMRGAPLVVAGLLANAQTNVEFSTGSILRPQFEPGFFVTAFERRPLGVELEICSRYLQRIVGWSGGWQSSSTTLSVVGKFTPTMANIPSIIIKDGVGAAVEFGVAFRDISAFTSGGLTVEGGYIDWTTSVAGYRNVGGISHNGKIFASSEL